MNSRRPAREPPSPAAKWLLDRFVAARGLELRPIAVGEVGAECHLLIAALHFVPGGVGEILNVRRVEHLADARNVPRPRAEPEIAFEVLKSLGPPQEPDFGVEVLAGEHVLGINPPPVGDSRRTGSWTEIVAGAIARVGLREVMHELDVLVELQHRIDAVGVVGRSVRRSAPGGWQSCRYGCAGGSRAESASL